MRIDNLRIHLAVVAAVLLATPGAALAGDAAAGKAPFVANCGSCHGEGGKGDGPVGAALNPPPRDFTVGEFKYGGTDQDIFDVISNGAAAKGGSALMAPWGAVIPEADRWSLVKYVRTLKDKKK